MISKYIKTKTKSFTCILLLLTTAILSIISAVSSQNSSTNLNSIKTLSIKNYKFNSEIETHLIKCQVEKLNQLLALQDSVTLETAILNYIKAFDQLYQIISDINNNIYKQSKTKTIIFELYKLANTLPNKLEYFDFYLSNASLTEISMSKRALYFSNFAKILILSGNNKGFSLISQVIAIIKNMSETETELNNIFVEIITHFEEIISMLINESDEKLEDTLSKYSDDLLYYSKNKINDDTYLAAKMKEVYAKSLISRKLYTEGISELSDAGNTYMSSFREKLEKHSTLAQESIKTAIQVFSNVLELCDKYSPDDSSQYSQELSDARNTLYVFSRARIEELKQDLKIDDEDYNIDNYQILNQIFIYFNDIYDSYIHFSSDMRKEIMDFYDSYLIIAYNFNFKSLSRSSIFDYKELSENYYNIFIFAYHLKKDIRYALKALSVIDSVSDYLKQKVDIIKESELCEKDSLDSKDRKEDKDKNNECYDALSSSSVDLAGILHKKIRASVLLKSEPSYIHYLKSEAFQYANNSIEYSLNTTYTNYYKLDNIESALKIMNYIYFDERFKEYN